MKPPDKLLLRLAQGLLGRGLAPQDHDYAQRMAELDGTVLDLQRGLVRWQICRTRGWCSAAQQTGEELLRWLGQLSAQAATQANILRAELDHPVIPPTLRSVYEDLRQLYDEFDPVTVDLRGRTVAVETEPITLEDRYLGPFKIELDLKALQRGVRHGVYKAIALDPHPAGSRENVTHPHVRDQELCEGDATAAVRSALSEGRLCDFFTVVRSVLQTYNAGSPYVALDQWDGLACHDCGDTMDSDDSQYCESCNHDFCESCMSYCRVCEESACRSCLDTCGNCDKSTCSDCLSDCALCGKPRCKNCLDQCNACHQEVCADCRDVCEACDQPMCSRCLKDDLCPACREKAEKDHDDSEPSDVADHVSLTACAREGAAAIPAQSVRGTRTHAAVGSPRNSIRARRRHRHAA